MPNPKKKSRKTWVIAVILVLIVASVATAMVLRKREVPIVVQTEKAARRNITELVVANGRVQPVLQVMINPEVSGEIVELPVKEGQLVKKGDLLVKIKPDNYIASRNSAEANYKSALAGKNLAKANLDKAALEFDRFKQLFEAKLVSDSQFLEAKTTKAVMDASFETSVHQVEQAKAALARTEDDLSKTTIFSPITGSVTKLKSQLGERVVGTAMMAGTEIMTIANLDAMEARVDIGEIDVVLIALGQHARLEVEAFRDRKFNGTVTEIANASKGLTAASGGSSQQEATKFEVKIRIDEKEVFRPGMTVTAEVETRSRSNVVSVPIQCVTTRLPKGEKPSKSEQAAEAERKENLAKNPKSGKQNEGPKPFEVVFLPEGDVAKMRKVKTGISDDNHIEITEGLKEGEEVVTGGYKAISRDLEEGKKISKEAPKADSGKDKK